LALSTTGNDFPEIGRHGLGGTYNYLPHKGHA
jgi:hypothetical protein